jgi:leader peptidase (prepilin peptidase) / N-methyltransferase
LSSIHYWVIVAAAGLGLIMGAVGTNFALQVPTGVGLPSLGRSVSFAGQSRGKLLIGASIAGIVSAILGLVFGWSFATPTLVICSALGVALAIVDLRCRRLPYAMLSLLYLANGLPFAIAAAASRDTGLIVQASVSAATAIVAFLALALALPGQLGLGDVFLFGWVVFSLAWFGWRAVEVGVLAGLAGQAVAGLVLRVRRGPGYKLPYGPALLLGWFVGVVTAAA